jgi:hypothetical protein
VRDKTLRRLESLEEGAGSGGAPAFWFRVRSPEGVISGEPPEGWEEAPGGERRVITFQVIRPDGDF